jgi:transposase
LKDKLNINSSNSGLPTSKEIYQKENKVRRKSVRKAGAQPGHAYQGYIRKNPDAVHIIDVTNEKCSCGGCLSLDSYSVHQKIEIPEIKPKIDEYRLAKKKCDNCGKVYKAKLDNYKILGSNAESVIGAMGGFFNNSKRDLQQILSQIFNLDISLGLISKTEERVSASLENRYKNLLEEAEESSHLHMDETGHKNRGKRGWCWFLGNEKLSFFHLSSSRGKKVIEKLLPEYLGNVISDRYAVYNYFDPDNRQVCLAHLRRDFKRFAHSSNKEISAVGVKLLDCIDLVFAAHKGYKLGKVTNIFYRRRAQKTRKKMYSFLKNIRHQSESIAAKRVAKNILKSFDMMWLFVDNDEIPPTNNFAERQIKHHVKYRKNSYHTWSDRGDRFLERIKSIYATAKLRNENPFDQLHKLILNPI